MPIKSPIVEIAKKVCPAVITVVVSKDLPKVEELINFPFGQANKGKKLKTHKTQVGGGSGFIVSEDGYVFTSNHVVADESAEYTVIVEPTKKFPAKVLSRNPINDIAVLKIPASPASQGGEAGQKLPFLETADERQIDIGEEVLAVGNALGEFTDTLSRGIVSGLSRYITAFGGVGNQMQNLRGLIQTDAAINPGNSGGPLVDMDGKVIGINTAMVMGAQNIGFAIPIAYAKKDLEEVKKYGKIKVPFLGVKYVLLSKELAVVNKLPVESGALVVRELLGESPIIKGTPAERAGIKEYDIILECNGEKITDKNPLGHIMQKCQIGSETILKVMRNGKEITLKVKFQEKD